MIARGEATISNTLEDVNLQLALYSNTGRLAQKRSAAVDPGVLPEYQELRSHAHALKKHTIENLDYYLEQLARNVEAAGGRVVYCEDGADVADFVLRLAKERNARLIVKSKSMTTEEIDLNDRVEEHGLEAVETDLGEYIIQLAGQKPYHIVAPSLHMTRYDVSDVFTRKLGIPEEHVPEKQTQIARGVLRQKFLSADIGITGANFLVADSGAVVLVENEGNARLTYTAPKIHIAVAGIEKVIPRAQDLGIFLKLLGRSATGQPLTSYTSFVSGPRRAGDLDGAQEFYLVLLDSGRTKLLQDPERRQSLYCIRCGACLNQCPVYRKIGGHNYPWVYSGPIGAILTPQFHGLEESPWLPFASSLCGACGEVCPVKIDIPKLLLDLRSDIVEDKQANGTSRLEHLVFRLFAFVASHPALYGLAMTVARRLAPSPGGWVSTLPFAPAPVRAWLRERDLAMPAKKSFRQLWRER